MWTYLTVNILLCEGEMVFATWCFWHQHKLTAWLFLIMSMICGTGIATLAHKKMEAK